MCEVLMKKRSSFYPHPDCLHTASLLCGVVCIIFSALLPFGTIASIISAGILLGEYGSLLLFSVVVCGVKILPKVTIGL